jgi:hypothetical protein
MRVRKAGLAHRLAKLGRSHFSLCVVSIHHHTLLLTLPSFGTFTSLSTSPPRIMADQEAEYVPPPAVDPEALLKEAEGAGDAALAEYTKKLLGETYSRMCCSSKGVSGALFCYWGWVGGGVGGWWFPCCLFVH